MLHSRPRKRRTSSLSTQLTLPAFLRHFPPRSSSSTPNQHSTPFWQDRAPSTDSLFDSQSTARYPISSVGHTEDERNVYAVHSAQVSQSTSHISRQQVQQLSTSNSLLSFQSPAPGRVDDSGRPATLHSIGSTAPFRYTPNHIRERSLELLSTNNRVETINDDHEYGLSHEFGFDSDPLPDNHQQDDIAYENESQRSWVASQSEGSSEDDTETGDDDPFLDINGDIGENELPSTIVAHTARYVLDLLMFTDFGCGEEKHTQVQEVHMNQEVVDNHHGLEATFPPYGLGTSKSPQETVGLSAKLLPRPRETRRSSIRNASVIRRYIEGRAIETHTQANVCLHQEHRPDVRPVQEFDADSLLCFPSGLGDIKTTVRLSFVLQTAYNLKTNLHVTKRVTFFDVDGKLRRRSLPLKMIPHLYIGTIEDFHNSIIFVFFPRLLDTTQPDTTWLTPEQSGKFFDNLLIPAVKESATDGTWHHLVPNSQAAYNKARAKGREQQASYRERGLMTHNTYVIQPSQLDEIWQTMLQRMNNPSLGLKQFEDMFLFVDMKNMKLQFKTSSPLESFVSFDRKLRQVFDVDRVDFLVDVATEITPPQVRGGGHNPTEGILHQDDNGEEGNEEVPITYLWKACCLQSQLAKIQTDAFDGRKGTVSTYYNGFLRDAVCMTMEPPRKSWIGRGGLHYAQFYNVHKEIEDANQVHPFAHPQLHQLAIDQAIYKKSTKGPAWDTLCQSYQNSKQRVLADYQNYRFNANGVRFEVRIAAPAFRILCDEVTRRSYPMGRLPSTPDFIWALATQRWTDFMLGNYAKLTSLIDFASIQSPTSGVTLRTSRLMYALLLCLQSFANTDFSRHSLLYRSQVTVEGVTRYGLGLKENLTERGFAWMSDVCDWDRFCFKPEVENHLITVNKMLGTYYKESTRLIQTTKHTLDYCYEQIRTTHPNSLREAAVLTAIAHFVLRQYRRDVLDRLEKMNEVVEEYREEAKKDEVYFCYEGLQQVLYVKPTLASGNKTACKTVRDMFEWLMGDSGQWNRTVMDGTRQGGEQTAWRRLLVQVTAAINVGERRDGRWKATLAREFNRSIWLVPYPNGDTGSFIQTVKKGSRLFWSMDRDKLGEWVWSKKAPRMGTPKPYPPTLDMDSTALGEYFNSISNTSSTVSLLSG